MKRSVTVVELKPMQNVIPNSADGWCARLHADDVTEEDRRAFQSWLAASADNRADYELSALTFALARGLAAAPELGASVVGTSNLQVRGAWLKGHGMRRPAAVAAALLSCVALSLIGYFGYSARPSYMTDVGEQKLVSLADGTTIQLNTASAINVDLESDHRQVTLKRGEAFFNVAPDRTRPFIVRAGAGEIRVVGTKFNVRVDGGQAVVTVIEGHVKVHDVDLLAGQGARVASAQPIVKTTDVNPARTVSWREGKIYFDREPLASVLQEVNRYTQAQFLIAGPAPADRTLSGVFRTGDTESVVFALRETYGLKLERDGDRILVR